MHCELTGFFRRLHAIPGHVGARGDEEGSRRLPSGKARTLQTGVVQPYGEREGEGGWEWGERRTDKVERREVSKWREEGVRGDSCG